MPIDDLAYLSQMPMAMYPQQILQRYDLAAHVTQADWNRCDLPQGVLTSV